jgi:DNA-binding beta-propeller fold protein YncE
MAQVVDPGTVVQTIDTSLWSPPSPDPAGIAYRPDTGELITCDSEVEEMAIFAGVNLWTHSVGGTVSSTASTTGYSNEPTGIAWDPAGGRVWISDDIDDLVFEIDFGPDGIWNTPDDVEFELDEYTDAGCDDLEDVTYDNVHDELFIAGGGISAICRVQPGVNGFFDGAPPAGDDVVTIFDVEPHGIEDPEGIIYDPFWDTLVVADRRSRDLWEFTPGGALLRRIDVDFPGGVKISGVAIAPGSTNPMLRNYWVTDRRVDNGEDPFENDGRIYEVVAIPLGGNGPPIVDAGPPQSIFWPTDTVNLDGFVSDDGHPYPPSVVASLWSALSGPGSVAFGDASSPVTTATFSEPGHYVLQLEGDDSDEQTIDTVTIDVTATYSLTVVVSGGGSVGADPAGGPHPDGTAVTLTAQPGGTSWRFAAWSGDASGTANPLVLVMDADKSVTAIFQPKGGGGGGGCGIGPELAATLPLLLWLRRRQRRA